jgi:hypothetical protein
VTTISEAKDRDLTCMDFSKKRRVLGLRDFAGDLIGQLSLARGELAAVKLSGRKGEALPRVCAEIAALKTQVKPAQSQIRNRPILSGLIGQLENLNPTREDVDQEKVNVERITELAVAMQTKDGLALIASPDPKVIGLAERQRQKHCEILVDHSRVLVRIKSIEEDNDAIRSPTLLSQYPELQGRCGKQPRFIRKDPSEVSHRTKRALHLELKQCVGP